MAMENDRLSGELTSLAGRYAKTLWDLAIDQGCVKIITEQFHDFIAFLEQNHEMEQTLLSPSLTRKEHAAVFAELSHKLNLHLLLERFLHMLADNRRLDLIRDIQTLYQSIYDENEHIYHAEVVSAYPLNKQQEETLHTLLSKQVDGRLLLTYARDPHLLGGFFVRFGNRVVDLTFANQLNKLANAMKG
jgi:F-type H+-transporting ATPase subunit delta